MLSTQVASVDPQRGQRIMSEKHARHIWHLARLSGSLTGSRPGAMQFQQLDLFDAPQELDCAEPAADQIEVQSQLLVDQNRNRLLEALFEQAGRDDDAVPHHHTYTGLAEELHSALGRALVDQLLSSEAFDPCWLVTGSAA